MQHDRENGAGVRDKMWVSVTVGEVETEQQGQVDPVGGLDQVDEQQVDQDQVGESEQKELKLERNPGQVDNVREAGKCGVENGGEQGRVCGGVQHDRENGAGVRDKMWVSVTPTMIRSKYTGIGGLTSGYKKFSQNRSKIKVKKYNKGDGFQPKIIKYFVSDQYNNDEKDSALLGG